MESSGESLEPRAPESQLSSCLGCRTRKLKCSRNTPSCTNCIRFDLSCVYEPGKTKPGLKRGTVEKLTKRLESLERKLNDRDAACRHDSPHQALTGLETFTQGQGAAALGALIAEIQNLSSTVSGLSRFIPPAISTAVAREVSHEGHRAHEDRSPKRRKVRDSMAPSVPSGGYEPWDPSMFSSTEQLTGLVDAYFSNVHPWIPMIHRSTFKKTMQDENTDSSCGTILQSMFIAALPYTDDSSSFTINTQDQVERVADQVLLTANKSLSVENLQALTILAFTYMGNGELSKSWPIIASLTRTVDFLGLGREDEDQCHIKGFLRPDALPSPTSWVEEEERRRVFWNIFILDRICSITTGWGIGLTAANVRRRLPICGTFWNHSIPRVAPFFGIWDKSAANISTSVAFLPTTHHHTSPNQPPELSGDEPGSTPESRQPHQVNTEVKTIGAFAYFVESLESLCRINMYFLRQQIDFRNRQEVSSWLMRFKELDIRLVHWKMFLPPKWKDPAVSPPETANILDPNMSLAHVTHNTSMILLHQRIGYPEPPLRSLKLPNLCSAETCLNAATETANITRNYLSRSSTCKTLSPHWAFCVFVAAKVLLVHSCFYDTQLSAQYWQLFHCLQQMGDRWNSNRAAEPKQSLAGQFASELQRLHETYQADPAFTVRVVSPVGGLQEGSGLCYSSTVPPSYNLWPDERDSGDPIMANHYPSNTTNRAVNGAIRNIGEADPVDWKSPSATSDSRRSTRSKAADDLSAIVASLAGEEFLELDRVISLDDFNLESIDLGDFANMSGHGDAQPGWPVIE